MTTIIEIKRQLIDQLKALGIADHEARRECELMVEHATGCDTAQQILNADQKLDKTQESLLGKISRQRQERIPLQYCLGHTWFLGLKFEVESGIFIPRADTEALVIKANQLISELDQKKLTIVEVGLGSGAIAISLLKMHPDRQVVAYDVSQTACSVSRKNANLNGVSARLRIECGDWRNLLPDDIDVLISNPPYIPKFQAQSLLPEVVVHEPHEALFGTEDDGLGFYRDFATLVPSHFRRGQGLIAMEVGDGQSGSVSQIFASQKWFDVQVDLDMSGAPRVVTARK